MYHQPRILIIGGSLVGPSTELFLRAKGYTDITVLEANPRPFSQSGGVMGVRFTTLEMLANVGINANNVKALNSPNVYAYDIHHGTYAMRGVSEFPGMVTSWDALHTELSHRVNVTRGHTVHTLIDDAGRTYALCSCGTEHDADLIIWADGRKSTGRSLLAPERPLTYNGYVVWRGLFETPTNIPVGFQRYYDITGGRLFSITEPVIQTGKSYFEFSHNLPEHVWKGITRKTPEEHAYMLPSYINRHPAVMDVIHANATGLPHRFEQIIDDAEISGIPVNDVDFPTQVVYHHTSGAISVLIGDAAIPVRLQVGAGLNQGLHQIYDFINAYHTRRRAAVDSWERAHLEELARWVEMGRSRAHRNNLGWYLPVHAGRTTAPKADQWTAPMWVTA